MDLLRRDLAAKRQLERLGLRAPACSEHLFNSRSVASHPGSHAACRMWLEAIREFAYDLGCPSLPVLLSQLDYKAALPNYTFGAMVYHRLTLADPDRSPRDRRGVIDQPAKLLLTRRWHCRGARDGLGFEAVAGRWQDLVQSWVDETVPDHDDIEYPAWDEWMGRRRNRALMRLPLPERAAELAAWPRGGIPERDEAPDTAQALRKMHGKVERILRAHLRLLTEPGTELLRGALTG